MFVGGVASCRSSRSGITELVAPQTLLPASQKKSTDSAFHDISRMMLHNVSITCYYLARGIPPNNCSGLPRVCTGTRIRYTVTL